MYNLLDKNQEITIVPQNFENSYKAKILDVKDDYFTIETIAEPSGILPKKINEFYSNTKYGTLYFSSDVKSIEGNKLTVSFPRKHRFLQRRAFTRIKMRSNLTLSFLSENIEALLLDVSAGGIKFDTQMSLDLNKLYSVNLKLTASTSIDCTFEPIRIVKNDDKTFTVSGRFKDLNYFDKMSLIQFCIRKKYENENR